MHAIRFHTAAIAIICCLSWLSVSKAEAVAGQNRMVKRAKRNRKQHPYQAPVPSPVPTESSFTRFTAPTRTGHYTRPPISAGNPSGYPPRNAESGVSPSAAPQSTVGWKSSPGGGGKKAGLGWNGQSGTQWKQFLDVPDNQFGWTYNWASLRNVDGKYPEGLNYVPMLHGDKFEHPAEWETNKEKFQDWHVTHVMSINEPDKPISAGGSDMPLDTAVKMHQKYFTAELNKKYKIVAPAYSGLDGFISWDKACKAQGGCNYDVVSLHFYGDDPVALETLLTDAQKEFPNKPLWVTEIGCIKYGETTEFCTDEKVIEFMKKALPILAARTERYSWQGSFASFEGAPDNRNNMMEPADNKLNEKGRIYATTV